MIETEEREVSLGKFIHIQKADAEASESEEGGDGVMHGCFKMLCMVVVPEGTQEHWCRILDTSLLYPVAVSRKVERPEIERAASAGGTVDAERRKLA